MRGYERETQVIISHPNVISCFPRCEEARDRRQEPRLLHQSAGGTELGFLLFDNHHEFITVNYANCTDYLLPIHNSEHVRTSNRFMKIILSFKYGN